jgi:thiol-disulfide isomerase/thioredoxin
LQAELEMGMNLHVLMLRLAHSAPATQTLMVMLFGLAVGLVSHQLLIRRSPTLTDMNTAPLRAGLLALPLVLLAALGVGRLGYQGQAQRAEQLRLAQTAPVRVSYGPADAPAIQVFTAPGCGPCRMLEARLGELVREGYAVQYIPVSMVGDEGWDQIEAAMCSADPRAAFERVYAMAPVPPAGPECHSRVRENQAVQQALGSQVYPTVIMPDGLLELGAPPIEKLREYLHATAPLPPAGGQAL